MKNFADAERLCQTAFLNAGPIWFASSPGKDTPVLFVSHDDFVFVMNCIAQMAYSHPDVRIISFVVMNNHFHFVIASRTESEIKAFFSSLTKRLSRIFPQIKDLDLDIRRVDSLNSLRNRIVYTHRNGYVADCDCTPFSYPWGTGSLYFNPERIEGRMSSLNVEARRHMFKGRDPKLPSEWGLVDDYVSPASYCSIAQGMSSFRNARHYFMQLTKNVEAYSEIATELDDEEYLTDGEVYSIVLKTARDQYGQASIRELTKGQRLDLARTLHYEFQSSNGQIRRVLGLSQYEIDSMFPLSKRI